MGFSKCKFFWKITEEKGKKRLDGYYLDGYQVDG